MTKLQIGGLKMVKETSKTLTYLYRSSKQFNADLLTLDNIIAFHYHFKYNAGYIVVEIGGASHE